MNMQRANCSSNLRMKNFLPKPRTSFIITLVCLSFCVDAGKAVFLFTNFYRKVRYIDTLICIWNWSKWKLVNQPSIYFVTTYTVIANIAPQKEVCLYWTLQTIFLNAILHKIFYYRVESEINDTRINICSKYATEKICYLNNFNDNIVLV